MAGTVAVVGAGTIGRGVAEALATAGRRTLLVDVSRQALDDAVAGIERAMRLAAFGGNAAPDPPQAILARIVPTTDLAELADADFVVENAPERIDLKLDLWARMDAAAPAHAVFAANTSAIPIATLAAATRRPERAIGMHFMNPVPLKDTVEVVRAGATSDATLASALDLLEAMGKRAIVVSDSPGFVSNRVLMLTVNESVAVVREGVSTAADVDDLFRSCFGHKMGPLETADLIGLDTILQTLEVLRGKLGDAKFEPDPLLRELVDRGALGRKSGEGFHSYGAHAQGAARR